MRPALVEACAAGLSAPLGKPLAACGPERFVNQRMGL
jgi:hypothetical protein